jgi:hypothetical protein
MSNLKSIIVLYGEPIEVFSDLKKFCKIKGLAYNTWKQKKLPTLFNNFSLEKEPVGEVSEYVTRMGELIKIQ